jgi:hypothetical protein
MEFQVYKYRGCSHDNIGDKIIDGSAFCFSEDRFPKILNKAYDRCLVWKFQG